MFITNKIGNVDKVWSKYLLDTLDLSLRKKLIGNNTNKFNYNINNNNNSNSKSIDEKPNKFIMIIYGVSCFIAGYYFRSKQ